jgi:hypothetical protein
MNTQNEPDLGFGWGSTLFGKHDYSQPAQNAGSEIIDACDKLREKYSLSGRPYEPLAAAAKAAIDRVARVLAVPTQPIGNPDELAIPAVGSRWVNGLGALVVVTSVTPLVVNYRYGDDIKSCDNTESFMRRFKPALDVAAETPTSPQPAPAVFTPPRFGELWRRKSDGKRYVCIRETLDRNRNVNLAFNDKGLTNYSHIHVDDLHANYTRVTPTKPGWRPIAEWDERDKSKRHLCRGASVTVLATASGYEGRQSVELKNAGVKWFIELDLPEVPNE